MADIKVYGASWCPDCKRSKKFFAEHRIPYEWIDIDDDAEGLRFVEQLQKRGRTIPTILFPGGRFLLEPAAGARRATVGGRSASGSSAGPVPGSAGGAAAGVDWGCPVRPPG